MGGCIPIYMGAPNINKYAPSEKSYIDLSKHPDKKQLVNYLWTLLYKKDLYDEYFQWRNEPLKKEFIEVEKKSWRKIPCRLCEYISKQ